MTEPVLRPIGRDELTPEQKPLYESILGERQGINTLTPLTDERGALLGPFDPFLRTPAIGTAMSHLGLALRNNASLPRRINEAAILTVSVHWDAAFEWYAHAAIVRNAALISEADIAAIEAREPAAEPEIALAQRAAQAILQAERLPEDLTRDVIDAWGESGLVELVALVGHYTNLALLMRGLGIEPPE